MLEPIERYYTAKVRRHGATPPGVDWASDLGQRLRFVQLLKVIGDWRQPLSLHDLGCGYGALLDHLAKCHHQARVRYVGSDVSEEMIRHARGRASACGEPEFVVAASELPLADYSIASGVFNVKLDHPVPAWERHVAGTLCALRASSRRGFSVNFLAPHALRARPDAAPFLYGPPPEQWLAYSRDTLACEAELLTGYGLPEYTLLVRHSS
jgi:SAM-dependent methyltransferase